MLTLQHLPDTVKINQQTSPKRTHINKSKNEKCSLKAHESLSLNYEV